MGGVRGNGIRHRYAHHPRDISLTDVLHEKQLDGLSLTAAQVNSGIKEVFDVVQRIRDSVRTGDRVDTFGLIERPEALQVLQQRPEHTNRQRQEPTRPFPDLMTEPL